MKPSTAARWAFVLTWLAGCGPTILPNVRQVPRPFRYPLVLRADGEEDAWVARSTPVRIRDLALVGRGGDLILAGVDPTAGVLLLDPAACGANPGMPACAEPAAVPWSQVGEVLVQERSRAGPWALRGLVCGAVAGAGLVLMSRRPEALSVIGGAASMGVFVGLPVGFLIGWVNGGETSYPTQRWRLVSPRMSSARAPLPAAPDLVPTPATPAAAAPVDMGPAR